MCRYERETIIIINVTNVLPKPKNVEFKENRETRSVHWKAVGHKFTFIRIICLTPMDMNFVVLAWHLQGFTWCINFT